MQTVNGRFDINSSAVNIATTDNVNVSPDRRSPVNNNSQLNMFENAPKVEQSADVVTSSGDHAFSENASAENDSPVEPSTGIVSSSEDSKGNSNLESSADIVTSSVDQVMDTSVHIDKSDSFSVNGANDGDMVTMPSSTTAMDVSCADNKAENVSDINSNKPCSTKAPCESSNIIENSIICTGSNEGARKNIDSHIMRVYLKSPEHNSQVSTSNTNTDENPSSNSVSSKGDINVDFNADCIAGDSREKSIDTRDCEPDSDTRKIGGK